MFWLHSSPISRLPKAAFVPEERRRKASWARRDDVWTIVRMLLVAMPGAPSSVLAPSSDALCY